MPVFRDRPAADIVVILLTITVSVVLFLATIGVITLRLLNPTVDLKGAEGAVGNILTTVVGALLGLITGRASARLEANGKKTEGVKQ
jgi:hypothetical protein